MSRYKRMRARTTKPRDERIGMLFDDLVELKVENAADLAYRTSIVTFDAISAPDMISLAFDCFELLEERELEFWVTGGWVADLQLGRVLRDHDDIDVFVVSGTAGDEAQGRLRSSDELQFLPINEVRITRGETVAMFREKLAIDIAMVNGDGSTGSVWGGLFEFDLSGLEERKRRIVWNNRDVAVRCLSPELHYLLKLAGLLHFKHEYRGKDLADMRSILPLLNEERLEVMKASWSDKIAVNPPAPSA